MEAPLAERIRPQNLSEYISQLHLVGEQGSLTHQIAKGIIPSLILWGPPGTGKTTLAQIMAQESKRPFFTLSAINSGVKDIREVIEKAKMSGGLFTAKNPILFIDEIHRFSKSQQDSLLAAVEKGWITLIGATTENPSFEVIPALLSRCQVYVLNAFSKNDLEQLLHRAIEQDEILKTKSITLTETEALLRLSGGDGRKLLNIFELIVNATEEDSIEITNEKVMKLLKGKENTTVELTLLRKGKRLTKTLTRGIIQIQSVAASYMLTPTVGYLKIDEFSVTTATEFKLAALKLKQAGMKKMVLDLRGNPGGVMQSAIEIADQFLPKDAIIVRVKGVHSGEQTYKATSDGFLEDMQLAVLMNSNSASASTPGNCSTPCSSACRPLLTR